MHEFRPPLSVAEGSCRPSVGHFGGRPDEFAPGVLEKLLDEGEADIAQGKFHDGEPVFAELDAMSRSRRDEKAK